MEVVVFGAGSLGSLIGGLLGRAHDVTLVGREPHVRAVAAGGLAVTGALEFAVRPRAVADLPPGASADLAVVAVKAFDTPAAARALAERDVGAALSLQNGMGNEERLAARLSCPVLAGTCTYGAELTEPGVVRCTGVGEVALGAREGGRSATADEAGAAFAAAGVETTVAADMPRRLWEKLAVNAAINQPTALARVENGALRDGPARTVAAAAAREVARVARAEGVELSDEAAATAIERVAAATAENRSSMYQDVRAGRPTEVDAIGGHVCERAREHDLAVPVTETTTALVRAWEAAGGLR